MNWKYSIIAVGHAKIKSIRTNNVNIIVNHPWKNIFNYEDLFNYYVDAKDLSEYNNAINDSYKYYEHNKRVFLIGTHIIMFLIMFLLILCVNIKKRIYMEKNLKKNYEKLNSVYEELSAAEEELKFQYKAMQQREEYLRVSKERYELAIDGANDIIWEWNILKNVFFASNKWEDITGYTLKESQDIKKILNKLVFKEDMIMFLDTFSKYLNNEIAYLKVECRIKDSFNRVKWIYVRGKAQRNKNGQIIKLAGSITDITDRKLIENKNKFLACYDKLTGLLNRSSFLDMLQKEMNKNRINNGKVAVLFLDIDNFKNVNDTLGHDYGDKLLKYISQRVSSKLGPRETIFRWGGDEFLILQSRIKNDLDREHLSKRILNVLKEPFDIAGKKLFTTVSIGISIFPDDGNSASALLKNADTAMYMAKEHGKNKYSFFHRDMFDKVVKRTNLENGIRNAIEKEEFRLAYQPQIDIKTGKMMGIEALLRWKSKDFGRYLQMNLYL